ncbi:MAG: peptide chain release factor N(5)-glutamine methyltransferase [Pyrinomonadaceae bacterium]
MPNIAESLANAATALKTAGIDDSRREAISLLCFALGKDRAFLIAHPEYELRRDEAELFDSLVKRRADREPFHHITGIKEFYGLDFLVSPDVLIPRPETEMLVAKSIELLTQGQNSPVFCEVGIGSGCIAISVLHNVASATAVGIDISDAAIATAKLNAENNRVSDRLTLLKSDIFDQLGQQHFDLIVSNPPYIPVREIPGLQPEVGDFEPHIALTDGSNGLSIVEKIIRRSSAYLKPGGSLVMEIGIGQAGEVSRMFDADRWVEVEIVPDIQAIPRMVFAVFG